MREVSLGQHIAKMLHVDDTAYFVDMFVGEVYLGDHEINFYNQYYSYRKSNNNNPKKRFKNI